MDELPDVGFYVLNEPALSAPPPDEVGIWQELAHLRTENYRWRECVVGIVQDTCQAHASSEGLAHAIEARVAHLGEQLGHLHRR